MVDGTVGKLKRRLRERGVGGALGCLGATILHGYEKEELIVVLKELDQVAEPKSTGDLRIEEFDSSHLPGLYALNRERGEAEGDPDFDRSLEYGSHGFAAMVDDRLVGCYWWVDRHGPVPHPDLFHLGREFELEDGDVYGFGLYLLEQYRGEGRAAEFLYHVESDLRRRGNRRLWGYVESDNRPARRLYSMRGYLQAWKVYNRRLSFMRWRSSVPLPGGG